MAPDRSSRHARVHARGQSVVRHQTILIVGPISVDAEYGAIVGHRTIAVRRSIVIATHCQVHRCRSTGNRRPPVSSADLSVSEPVCFARLASTNRSEAARAFVTYRSKSSSARSSVSTVPMIRRSKTRMLRPGKISSTFRALFVDRCPAAPAHAALGAALGGGTRVGRWALAPVSCTAHNPTGGSADPLISPSSPGRRFSAW